ncbi:MAG: PHP domain-containing protein [Desulfobacterales bacterium]|nr:MAG: PHP domain-containing protein [Desulfobacterales bacterium]
MGKSKLKKYKADLHIHSCLSPCGDWDMSPRKIIQKSLEVGLDLIAICDHNTAENAGVAMREGQKKGIHVLPGMEVCSREEVHILALFAELSQALEMQSYVYANLPGENKPEVFGCQVVANEKDEVLGENPRLLIGATRLGLHDIVAKTHSLGGLSFCCHVDRPAYGIINQLGFIPPDLDLDGVEISRHVVLAEAHNAVSGIEKFSCITSSDAHFIDDIGKVWTVFQMAAPTIEEIRKSILKQDGRRILV